MAEVKLFAYGLLMEGMRYHQSHLAGRFSSMVPGEVRALLLYLKSVDCPALMAGGEKVLGEVYMVDDELFVKLDYLYGVKANDPKNSEYSRRLIEVSTGEGHTVEAYAYHLRESVRRTRFPNAVKIEDGNWRRLFDKMEKQKLEEAVRKHPIN